MENGLWMDYGWMDGYVWIMDWILFIFFIIHVKNINLVTYIKTIMQ